MMDDIIIGHRHIAGWHWLSKMNGTTRSVSKPQDPSQLWNNNRRSVFGEWQGDFSASGARWYRRRVERNGRSRWGGKTRVWTR